MSEYTPSEQGSRRFSRRLLGRKKPTSKGATAPAIIQSDSPAVPFTALYTPTPTPRERRSIHLDFTPIVTPTPRKSTHRRSFIPQHLQAYNKQFLIGLGVFLTLSAVYKGLSIFKDALKNGPDVVQTDAIFTDESPILTSTESVTLVETEDIILDPMILRLYEESIVQVSNLTREISNLHAEMQSSLAASKSACDMNLSIYTDKLNMTSSSLSRCEARIEQIELDSSRFMEKLESDFQQNLATIITSKNKQISDLESTVLNLQMEVKTHTNKKPDPVQPLPPITPVKEVPEAGTKTVEKLDKDFVKSSIAILILSGIATLSLIAAAYLYQDRKRLMIESNRQLDASHITAASSPPPVVLEAELVSSSEEHLAMSIEDTRASILRGVTIRVREIEEQHEAEMIRLRSLLLETGDASREISLAIKGIMSDTSMVSTAAHNTPGLSDILSSSSDEEDNELQFSSLSQRLESSATTPIRIETKNWLSKAKIQSQQPTACPPSSVPQPAIIESFVIGSPKLPTGTNLMEYAVTESSSDESSSEMALEQIRGNFGFTH